MSELRRVDIGQRVRRPGREGARPILAWVPIRRLVIDETYQRPIGKRGWRQVEKIAAEFDWKRFTPVLLASTGGETYAIIDGQHRTHAALLAGHDGVPATIVDATLREAALAFSNVNAQVTRITGFQILKAAIAAGEPWAIDARDAVTAAGCRLMDYNKSAAQKRPREVYALGLIKGLVADGMGELVTVGLGALSACPHHGNSVETYQQYILRPWLMALGQNQQFLRMDLAGFLAGFDLLQAREEALARSRVTRESAPPILTREIVAALRAFRQEAAA